MTDCVARVAFLPSGRAGVFAVGTPLLEAARALGVFVESVCGGRGLCGRCQVAVREGATDWAAAAARGRFVLGPGRVLSCAARVAGDVVVEVPAEFAVSWQVVRTRAETRRVAPDPPRPGFGLAVDVGTVTLAAQLVDLTSGRPVAAAGTATPRGRVGAVRGAVATLAVRVCGMAGVRPGDVAEAVAAGNAAMMAAVAGDGGWLPIAPGAEVVELPGVSADLGADVVAAVLAEGGAGSEESVLVVDLGACVEVALAHGGRVWATRAETGAVFEGGGVSAGQRAAPGAIEAVRIEDATGAVRVKVIGVDAWSDAEGFEDAASVFGVTGVCAAGLVSAVAEMDRVGLGDCVLRDGAMPIGVTAQDVAVLRRAAGGVREAVSAVMAAAGLVSVDRVRLAGAFGSHVDSKAAVAVGLLPEGARERVASVGHAVGTGLRMALVSRVHREAALALAARIETVGSGGAH